MPVGGIRWRLAGARVDGALTSAVLRTCSRPCSRWVRRVGIQGRPRRRGRGTLLGGETPALPRAPRRPGTQEIRVRRSGRGGRRRGGIGPADRWRRRGSGRADGNWDARGAGRLRVAPLGEEAAELNSGLLLEDTTDHLDAMVEAGVPQDVAHGTRGPGLRVPRREDDTIDPRLHDRTRTHRARLQGDHQRAAHQIPTVQPTPGITQSDDLGVGGRVVVAFALVPPLPDGAPSRVQDHGTDGNVTALPRLVRKEQGTPHSLTQTVRRHHVDQTTVPAQGTRPSVGGPRRPGRPGLRDTLKACSSSSRTTR